MQTGFTGGGIDRADRLRLNEGEILGQARRPEARLLLLDGFDPVADEEGRLTWLPIVGWGEDRIFLGLADDVPLFAPLVSAPPVGERPAHLMRVLAQMSARDAAVWGMARSLNEWHNRNRFCGQCGTPTRPFRAGWCRVCLACAAELYPRVDPVVIMLAQHEGRVLLGRQPRFPLRRYSALAGFVEPGESIEEAVARELWEEAGVVASGVDYVASQPWPFPHSLMIACTAQAEGAALTIDSNELEDAIWVDRAGVEAALAGDPDAPFLAPPPYAIAHSLLVHWLADSAG